MEIESSIAGIVLCGGKSSRMGRSKADLPFGSETMLQRVVRILQQVVDHVVVVGAENQTFPDLGPHVTTTTDSVAYGGPLIGLGVGLNAITKPPLVCSTAYLTSCDAPFLKPDFIKELLLRLEEADVAVPKDDQHFYPLSAAYRTNVQATVNELIEQGERRPRALFSLCKTISVSTATLRRVDPELQSLVNLNTPADYRAALDALGLAIPAWLNDSD